MWKFCGLAMVIGLAGCASIGTGVSDGALAEWKAYRTDLLEQRDQGKVDPVVAQERIEARYQQLYGADPVMDGAFAYGLKLYEAADAGDLSVTEADRLAQSR